MNHYVLGAWAIWRKLQKENDVAERFSVGKGGPQDRIQRWLQKLLVDNLHVFTDNNHPSLHDIL